MKLQYLGDWRDAFKWDLLHWLCVDSAPAFARLVFIPLLTPDDQNPADGRIPPSRFRARPFIQAFVNSLSEAPRDLRRVTALGNADPGRHIDVVVHGYDRHVPSRDRRGDYWADFDWAHDNSIVFLDPDNGFETKTNRGDKWVLHAEVAQLVDNLPPSSAVVVYQHRPHETWNAVFAKLAESLSYVPFAAAAYDHGLAFVVASRSGSTYQRVVDAMRRYVAGHGQVRWAELRRVDV